MDRWRFFLCRIRCRSFGAKCYRTKKKKKIRQQTLSRESSLNWLSEYIFADLYFYKREAKNRRRKKERACQKYRAINNEKVA